MFRSWRKQLGFLIVLAMTCVSVVPVAHAASAPNIITYQGRVLNANGVPVSDTTLSMIFQLYNASTGGTCLWSNSSASCASSTARSVTLTTGLFTENLGDTAASYAAISDSIFGDNAGVYLQVTIAGETLTPRKQLTAAPYALNADTLDGIDSTVLQLFETGSSRTFEDDAPVIVGTNSAFSFASGATGDLRVEDEIEVMGDGYIDNDLVVGASTSSTETIANAGFSLGGDDLFVAGLFGVEGGIFTDGQILISGVSTDITTSAGESLMLAPATTTVTNAAGGTLLLIGGVANGTGTSGSVSITGGDASGATGAAGSVILDAGAANGGTTGGIIIGYTNSNNVSICNTENCDTIAIASNTDADIITIGDSSDNVSITDAQWSITEAGLITTANDLAVNGDDITADGVLTIDAVATIQLGTDDDFLPQLGAADADLGASGTRWDNVFAVAGNFSGDLTISGDDLFMATNTSGFILVADGTNYNPVDVSGDVDVSSAGVATIQSNSVALSTDTTGNYVATIADAGPGDIAVVGSGSEGAAVTLDIVDDALDFTELSDTLALDASTSIAMDGSEAFTITNGGTGNVIVNLSSTGDFVIQDNGIAFLTLSDAGTLTADGPSIFNSDVDLIFTSGENLLITNSTAVTEVVDLTATAVGNDAVEINFTLGNDSDVDTVSALDVIVTSATTGDADVLRGINIDTLSNPDGTVGETGLRIGSGWDVNLRLADTSAVVGIDDNGNLSIQDGLGNSLLSLTDNANTGDLVLTGDVTAQGDNIDSAGAPLVLNATAADEVRIGTGSPGVATGAGDLYVTDGLEVDGALDVAGTASVADLACSDCLDFTEFGDAMTLDQSTSIDTAGFLYTITNSGSGNIFFDLNSTGDFVLRDGGTDFFLFNDDRSLDYVTNQTTTDPFDFTADSLTAGIGLDLSFDALTTGKGVNVNTTSSALTSGRVVDVDHTATYTTTNNVSGNGLRVNRALTVNGAGQTLTVSGDLLNITNTGTQTAGTLTDTSDLLSVNQSYAAAIGDGIEILNAGVGRALFIDQDGNGNSLVIDSESTATNVVSIDGSTTTSGQLIQLIGGDFTNDTGRAIFIDVTETTATADLVMIQTDVGSTNNDVFRIEADGEVFSDVGFTAGAFSTNYLDGEIQTTSDMLLDIDGGDLTFDQATVIGDGGDALTINSSGTLTVNDTFIAGTGALTLQSAASGALILDASSGRVSTNTGDDFSIGVDSLVSAFSVDESANLVRVGDGTGTNGEIDIYASNGNSGSLTWSTGDYLDVGGGALQVTNFMSVTDGLGVNAETVVNVGVSPSRTLTANSNEYGGHFTISSGTNKNGNTFNLRGLLGMSTFTSDLVSGPTEMSGVFGYGRLQSNSQTAPGVAGVVGAVNSATAGGTITDAMGVLGRVEAGSGTITNGYGGAFTNATAGTNRYGLIATASGGTNNYSGYFHSARVQIDGNVTPDTPSVATGAGDLFVTDALEVDGAVDIAGAVTMSGGLDLNGHLLDLDADNDTSLIASTDDQIDWEIGGVTQTLIMRDPLGADDASSTINPILEINYVTPADTTGTNVHAGLLLDIDVGNATGGTNRISGITVESMVGDAQVTELHALRVDALTGSASVNETAINVADGWDAGIYLEGTSPNFWIGNGSRLAFQDSSGNDIAILRDVSAVGNHSIVIDSDTAWMLDSGADSDVDLTTALNEMLLILPQGTGDTRFSIDADSVVELVASAAPGVDLFTITNSGQATTTAGVNALSITHSASNATTDAVSITPAFAGGATDGLVYQGININAFSPTNAAGIDTVAGINVAAVTDPGATISSYALTLNSGWDAQVYFNDTSSILQVENTGTLRFQDSQLNELMTLKDNGTNGTLVVRYLESSNDNALDVSGGIATVVGDAGEDLNLNGGINNSGGSGGNGGGVYIRGAAAAGNGTAARAGGDVIIESGASTIGTGNAGTIKVVGGDSNAGQNGNVDIQSGGSPTVLSFNGGDIGLSADDDIFISADDDVTMSVAASSALISLFDNAFSKTINIGSVLTDSADTVSIATHATTADTIAIGNIHASTTLGIFGGNDWEITTNGYISVDLSDGNASTEAVCGTDGTENSTFSRLDDCTTSVNADYAERYPAAADVEYGDIVVPGETVVYTQDEFVGRQAIRQAVKSSYAYQGPVIGIASNNYGDFTSAGGNVAEEDNPVPIALVGRVPVKVTSEGGSISAGDYLTTSSTPGTAMRATKVGRVIGMALEDWDGVSATVMVQVNNSWSMGDVIGTDGTSTLVTDNVIVSSVETASADEPSFDSYGLALRGSAWNGSEAEAVEMMLQNVVDDQDNYRLSIRNTSEAEVAYVTNEGTMKIAGDMVIGGRLYPSDRGTAQTSRYIYYDGSSGPGGDFMRTNAKGWSTGSYDFAEMFPSEEELVSGDVVAFAGSGEMVRRATGVEGEQLSGIVSTRPGFLAGENVEGAYPIALAGRVPTKVNTQNGAIAVGDPLTISSVAGQAMKAENAGQIVGYALESYTGSESDNLILTYVNLGYWSGGPQTITIVQNVASQASSDAQSFAALNMSGNIYMATNQILSIGRLEGVSAVWSIESDGTIRTQGSLTTVTESYQGEDVQTIAVTSPESVITLTGTATLSGGRAEVRFEDVVPEYNDVISASAPIRVVVTPSGPVSLYVSEKDQNHFVVERFVGSTDVEFDWMVTGYRKGYEPEEEGGEVEEVAQVEEEVEQEQTPEDESVVEEESANPESPDETLIDSATQDDGSQTTEPFDAVIETPSTPEP